MPDSINREGGRQHARIRRVLARGTISDSYRVVCSTLPEVQGRDIIPAYPEASDDQDLGEGCCFPGGNRLPVGRNHNLC